MRTARKRTSYHHWSATEDRVLRREYRRTPKAELAVRLGVTIKALYLRAVLLELTVRQFRWSKRAVNKVRRMSSGGYSDTEIATALGGIDRHRVTAKRKELGLPTLFGVKGAKWHERKRLEVAKQTKKQLKKAGAKSLGELRSRMFGQLGTEYGLPAGLPLRAVQVVLVLAEGPMTRRQIVERLGMKWKPLSRQNLCCRNQGGSITAVLLARGLICRIHRARSGGEKGVRIPDLYMLTGHAMELLTAHAKGGPSRGG